MRPARFKSNFAFFLRLVITVGWLAIFNCQAQIDPMHRSLLEFGYDQPLTAHLDYLPGFAQRSSWQTGAVGGVSFAPKNKKFKIVLRYGYGFNAIRNGREGAKHRAAVSI